MDKLISSDLEKNIDMIKTFTDLLFQNQSQNQSQQTIPEPPHTENQASIGSSKSSSEDLVSSFWNFLNNKEFMAKFFLSSLEEITFKSMVQNIKEKFNVQFKGKEELIEAIQAARNKKNMSVIKETKSKAKEKTPLEGRKAKRYDRRRRSKDNLLNSNPSNSQLIQVQSNNELKNNCLNNKLSEIIKNTNNNLIEENIGINNNQFSNMNNITNDSDKTNKKQHKKLGSRYNLRFLDKTRSLYINTLVKSNVKTKYFNENTCVDKKLFRMIPSPYYIENYLKPKSHEKPIESEEEEEGKVPRKMLLQEGSTETAVHFRTIKQENPKMNNKSGEMASEAKGCLLDQEAEGKVKDKEKVETENLIRKEDSDSSRNEASKQIQQTNMRQSPEKAENKVVPVISAEFEINKEEIKSEIQNKSKFIILNNNNGSIIGKPQKNMEMLKKKREKDEKTQDEPSKPVVPILKVKGKNKILESIENINKNQKTLFKVIKFHKRLDLLTSQENEDEDTESIKNNNNTYCNYYNTSSCHEGLRSFQQQPQIYSVCSDNYTIHNNNPDYNTNLQLNFLKEQQRDFIDNQVRNYIDQHNNEFKEFKDKEMKTSTKENNNNANTEQEPENEEFFKEILNTDMNQIKVQSIPYKKSFAFYRCRNYERNIKSEHGYCVVKIFEISGQYIGLEKMRIILDVFKNYHGFEFRRFIFERCVNTAFLELPKFYKKYKFSMSEREKKFLELMYDIKTRIEKNQENILKNPDMILPFCHLRIEKNLFNEWKKKHKNWDFSEYTEDTCYGPMEIKLYPEKLFMEKAKEKQVEETKEVLLDKDKVMPKKVESLIENKANNKESNLENQEEHKDNNTVIGINKNIISSSSTSFEKINSDGSSKLITCNSTSNNSCINNSTCYSSFQPYQKSEFKSFSKFNSMSSSISKQLNPNQNGNNSNNNSSNCPLEPLNNNKNNNFKTFSRAITTSNRNPLMNLAYNFPWNNGNNTNFSSFYPQQNNLNHPIFWNFPGNFNKYYFANNYLLQPSNNKENSFIENNIKPNSKNNLNEIQNQPNHSAFEASKKRPKNYSEANLQINTEDFTIVNQSVNNSNTSVASVVKVSQEQKLQAIDSEPQEKESNENNKQFCLNPLQQVALEPTNNYNNNNSTMSNFALTLKSNNFSSQSQGCSAPITTPYQVNNTTNNNFFINVTSSEPNFQAQKLFQSTPEFKPKNEVDIDFNFYESINNEKKKLKEHEKVNVNPFSSNLPGMSSLINTLMNKTPNTQNSIIMEKNLSEYTYTANLPLYSSNDSTLPLNERKSEFLNNNPIPRIEFFEKQSNFQRKNSKDLSNSLREIDKFSSDKIDEEGILEDSDQDEVGTQNDNNTLSPKLKARMVRKMFKTRSFMREQSKKFKSFLKNFQLSDEVRKNRELTLEEFRRKKREAYEQLREEEKNYYSRCKQNYSSINQVIPQKKKVHLVISNNEAHEGFQPIFQIKKLERNKGLLNNENANNNEKNQSMSLLIQSKGDGEKESNILRKEEDANDQVRSERL